MNSQKKIINESNKKSEFIHFSTSSQLDNSNKVYVNNLKKSILNKNQKYIKQTPITQINNNSNFNSSVTNSINKTTITNKYKTTKNSPNKIFKLENPKSLKYFHKQKTNTNILSNDNKKTNKLNSKISINSIIINKNVNNKIIITKKHLSKEKVMVGEMFKKKLNKKKIQKSITTKNSNNNSINPNNISNRNIQINSSEIIIPSLKFSNINNSNKFQNLKEPLIESWEESKFKNNKFDNINYTNFKSSSRILKNIKSYKEKEPIKRIDFLTDKHLKEKKLNYYGQTSKNFYDIKKYIESVFYNQPQPQRHNNLHFPKNKKFNTFGNKKLLNKIENEKICLSSNRKSSTKNEIEVNNKNKIKANYLNKDEYTIFVKSNYHTKNSNKISNNTTKRHSRKESLEKNYKKQNKELKVKTIQSKIGKPIRLSSENNINNQKFTNKSISTNNYSNQNSEFINKSNNIINKKSDNDYHYIYNNYLLKNLKGIQNTLNNKKKKVYTAKPSKEKINNQKIFQKNNYLDKIFKNSKKNSLNFRTHNCSKEEIKFKRNLSYKFKTPRHHLDKKKINVNKNGILTAKIKNIKKLKTPTHKNVDNFYNNIIIDKLSGTNSKIEINKKYSYTKNKLYKQKLENINEEKNTVHNEKNKIKKVEIKDKNIEIKKENNKRKDKDNIKEKKISDKDKSDVEEDISLLNYLNNNIDNLSSSNTDTSMLNESFESSKNPLKENKYLTFNKSKEIISNYIKQYYLKHNKYPKTKMKFYKYGRLLGKGAYGKVNLCLHTLTGRLVAIKSINKSKITKERQKQKIKIETSIMKTLSDSNNIVKVFETYETKKHICIVMEYICAGDLLSYIKKRSKLTETVAKFIFKQIILALQYIHSHNIVHRDIKLDNILIDLDNNIKICDFGVSKILKKGELMFDQCGTPTYIAPEILKNMGYEGFGVDIWSAGVVLYSMLSGTVPFKGGDLKELNKLIIEGDYKTINHISKEANHLLKCLLEVEPKNRIKIEDILVHPWMINVDLNLFMTKNLFTNAENILLAKSNVDYSDINNKENMVENFDIKNLDTEEENINQNIVTKSIILAPFNSSVSFEEDEDESIIKDNFDFNNPDLKIRNGIIKFSPKAKDLNRNYELNNNQEIDNGIIILSYDYEEKDKKDKSPYDGSYNSKFQIKQFSLLGEIEYNNKNTINKKNNVLNEKILEKIIILGYDKDYVKKCINNKEFNYATATYKLLDKYFLNY